MQQFKIGNTDVGIEAAGVRRVRFSLRALLLMTALLCTVASHTWTSYELHKLRQEAQRLRDELGYLTIKDGDLVHAIALAPEEGSTTKRWRWRLHLPPGRRFRLYYKFSELPVDGLPRGNDGFLEDLPGAATLTASAVREPTGAWRFVLHWDSARNPYGQTHMQAITPDKWLREDASLSWDLAGSDTTESVPQGEPMVLLRLRPSKIVTTPAACQE
jgi:hypothetical protein